MQEFQEHEIEWTREKAARFWKVLARSVADRDYFSNAVGRSVILEARQRGVKLDGRVLDYGCGPGHLLSHLVQLTKSVEGADFSEPSLAEAKRRVASHPSFRGVTLISALPSVLPPNAYDTVFFIETIEHLIGDDLPHTLHELYRLVRPGGCVVVTTPNNEDLDRSKRCCPDCGCVFHLVQHVSSWTKDSLSKALEHVGFETVHCQPITFRREYELQRIRALADWMRRRAPQSLLYVGRKPSA